MRNKNKPALIAEMMSIAVKLYNPEDYKHKPLG
jgi:hypothetical protein